MGRFLRILISIHQNYKIQFTCVVVDCPITILQMIMGSGHLTKGLSL